MKTYQFSIILTPSTRSYLSVYIAKEKIWCEAVQIINCRSKYFESMFDDRISWVNTFFFSKFIIAMGGCVHLVSNVFYYTWHTTLLRSLCCHLDVVLLEIYAWGGKCEKLSTVKIALDTQHILFTSSCVYFNGTLSWGG